MVQPEFEFKQGLQLFFVRKILEERYKRASLVGQKLGDEFFGAWSGIVRADDKPPVTLSVPEQFRQDLASKFSERQLQSVKRAGEKPSQSSKEDPDLSFAHAAYHPLLMNPRFSDLFQLLSDSDLGELMKIPYPSDTSLLGVTLSSSVPEGVIREAILRELKKDELTEDDYSRVTTLDLSKSELTTLDPLKRLTNLTELRLTDTPVSSLEPLNGLTKLKSLWLGGTQVSSLEPLKGLTKLTELRFDHTPVSSLEPLQRLKKADKALPRQHAGVVVGAA